VLFVARAIQVDLNERSGLKTMDRDDCASPIGVVAMGKRLTRFLRQSPAHRHEQQVRDDWARRNRKK
jgi:hypothetical protein